MSEIPGTEAGGAPSAGGAIPLVRLDEVTWEIPRDARPGMRVAARIFADGELMEKIRRDRSLEQLANVATLPGIFGMAMAMPDVHEGYGFPVGGVAATAGPDAVVSPGGIGFDINCGVRLLATGMRADELEDDLPRVAHELSRSIPTGYGRHGRLSLSGGELEAVLEQGCPYVVRQLGLGLEEDLAFIEAGGCLASADAGRVSERARLRGQDQLGTLGGGNHFIELERVEAVIDPAAAQAYGLFPGQLTILIHTGSRGLGHQVCTDSVRRMDEALPRFGIHLPDRQLACAPLSSKEAADYLAAMAAAANFAWCNRQVLTHRIREVFARTLPRRGGPPRVVYDVAHNIAKMERHWGRPVCVHRKGATRALGPSSPELPPPYRGVGQPVMIPGSMGTASFVLAGNDESAEISFSSACHGAGRAMSRAAAKRAVHGDLLRKELEARGISVECASNSELAEEAPLAYKDVDRVVDVVARAGIARKVARLVPLAVLKG